jgi:tetratricopeptide (TPR) repeat protein
LIYTAMQQPRNAIVDYEAALNLGLNSTELYVEMAMGYTRIEDLDLALRMANIAVEQDAFSAEAHYVRGLVLLLLGQYYPASVDATLALETKPNYIEALGLRATIYLNLGRWQEAIVDFESAYSLDQTYIDALYGIAQAQVALGDLDAAQASLEEYLEAAPPNARNRAGAEALLAAVIAGVTPTPTPGP